MYISAQILNLIQLNPQLLSKMSSARTLTWPRIFF
uniref:Uncharacterized protein n=1 Tax=Arundo donax TaxID=35708 RepID=A0A0A9ASJ1_ARUDO